jgi:hypothetical protein
MLGICTTGATFIRASRICGSRVTSFVVVATSLESTSKYSMIYRQLARGLKSNTDVECRFGVS